MIQATTWAAAQEVFDFLRIATATFERSCEGPRMKWGFQTAAGVEDMPSVGNSAQ